MKKQTKMSGQGKINKKVFIGFFINNNYSLDDRSHVLKKWTKYKVFFNMR